MKGFLGAEDVDLDFRRILKEARDEQGRRVFETFSSNDMSSLVAEGRDGTNTKEHHGDKIRRPRKRWMAARSPGTADSQLEPSGKKGDGCSERLFGKMRPSQSGH